jgi:hypothetical protein
MGHQGLLEHGQGDTLFFQFDDAVQASTQNETAVDLEFDGIGGLLAVAGRQVGRGQPQCTLGVDAQFDTGERLPGRIALASSWMPTRCCRPERSRPF